MAECVRCCYLVREFTGLKPCDFVDVCSHSDSPLTIRFWAHYPLYIKNVDRSFSNPKRDLIRVKECHLVHISHMVFQKHTISNDKTKLFFRDRVQLNKFYEKQNRLFSVELKKIKLL